MWAVAAASLAYWGLKLSTSASAVVAAPAAGTATPVADTALVAKALGAGKGNGQAAPVPQAASRFQLVGVVAGDGRHGVAVIAVDGKPPKSLRVGSQIEDGLVLQSVQRRSVSLGPSMEGPAAFTLELPGPRKQGPGQ